MIKAILKAIRAVKKRLTTRTLTEIYSYVGDDGLTHISLKFKTKQSAQTQVGNALVFMIAAALRLGFAKKKIHNIVELVYRQEVLGENVVDELRRKEKEEQA